MAFRIARRAALAAASVTIAATGLLATGGPASAAAHPTGGRTAIVSHHVQLLDTHDDSRSRDAGRAGNDNDARRRWVTTKSNGPCTTTHPPTGQTTTPADAGSTTRSNGPCTTTHPPTGRTTATTVDAGSVTMIERIRDHDGPHHWVRDEYKGRSYRRVPLHPCSSLCFTHPQRLPRPFTPATGPPRRPPARRHPHPAARVAGPEPAKRGPQHGLTPPGPRARSCTSFPGRLAPTPAIADDSHLPRQTRCPPWTKW